MTKTTIALMSLALAATVVMAQDKPAATAAPAKPAAQAATPADADPVIISTTTVKIHKSDFEAAVKTLPQEYQQYAAGPGKKQFAEDYLRMKLLAAEGMKAGLQNEPEVVAQINLIKENLVAQAEVAKLEKSINISDADLQAAYDADKKSYEQVKARHILIAFKGSAAAQAGKPELTDEQAKAKAEEIRAKLVAGADFAELAKKESDDTGSGANGGDLGSFGHGQMVPEFEKAAFEGKPGEITPVVRTQYGYHVIQVQEHGSTPLAQVKATLDKKLRQQKLQQQMDAFKTAANPTFDAAYFATPAAAMSPDGAEPAAAAQAAASKPAAEAKKSDAKATKKP